MKKIGMGILLALMLMGMACAGLAREAEEANPAQDFFGIWQDSTSGRAVLKILPMYAFGVEDEELDYFATVTWGSSVSEETIHYITASFDDALNALVYRNGMMSELTYLEDGSVEREEFRWDDAQGSLAMGKDGKIRWTDSKETEAANCLFVRTLSEVPSAQELREKFMLPVAQLEENTAGAQLKQNLLVAELAQYCREKEFWNMDERSLEKAVGEAADGLSPEMRSAFGAHLDPVMNGTFDAFRAFESVRAGFADAGVEAKMEEIITEGDTYLSCEILYTLALTTSSTTGD